MIGVGRSMRVWARPCPTDLRKGYNGLFGLVQGELGRDPLSGDLFLFVNRKLNSCKVLLWDGTGLCIFSKRLERGTFEIPAATSGKGYLAVDQATLVALLEGVPLTQRRRTWYRKMQA